MNIESLDSTTACTAHQKAPLSPTREITPTPTIITNVTDLTLNNKPSPADDEHKKRDSTASSEATSNRKCCWCACTSLLALVACAVAGVFVAQVLMGDIYSGDRESQEQRLKLVYRILRETPLIGKGLLLVLKSHLVMFCPLYSLHVLLGSIFRLWLSRFNRFNHNKIGRYQIAYFPNYIIFKYRL